MDQTPLPTTNPIASTVNETVVKAIDASVPLAEDAIIAAAPIMGTPIWKQIWEATFGYFAGQLGKALGKLGGYVAIDVQEYFALRTAANTLIQLQAAQKSGDQNAIQKANDAMDQSVAPILHYVGDARVK